MVVSGITSAMISTILRIGIVALKTHLKHEEAVIKTLKSLGIPTEPEDNFDSRYIHTLVRYGIFKPEEILNFFRNEHIRKAFQQSYSKGDPNILLKEAEGIIDWNYETNKLVGQLA